jgi:hypothetical protein
MEPTDFAAGFRQAMGGGPKSSLFSHEGEYWNIACAPIRPGIVALSLWRMIGYKEMKPKEDGQYVGEFRPQELRETIQQGIALLRRRDGTAGMRSHDGDLSINIFRDADLRVMLWVGRYGGRKNAQGYEGEIGHAALIALRDWLRDFSADN